MTTIFHYMMHKEMKNYMDDILEKSRTSEGHVDVLRKVLARQYKLRMNPNMCVFGVGSGKLLRFIVSKRGFEIDPMKVKAIVNMPSLMNFKELREFLGRLQFVRRFIS